MGIVENEKFRCFIKQWIKCMVPTLFSPLPLYNASGETQSRFEETVKNILSIAHRDYISRTEHGDDPESVMQELLESSLFGNLGNCST